MNPDHSISLAVGLNVVGCNWLIFDLNHPCRAPVSRAQATKLYVEVLLIYYIRK